MMVDNGLEQTTIEWFWRISCGTRLDYDEQLQLIDSSDDEQ